MSIPPNQAVSSCYHNLADPLIHAPNMPYLGGISRVFRECYMGEQGEALYQEYLDRLRGCISDRMFTSILNSIPEEHKRTNRQIVQFLFEKTKRNVLSYPGGRSRWNEFLQEPFNPRGYLKLAPWMNTQRRMRLAKTDRIVQASESVGKVTLSALWSTSLALVSCRSMSTISKWMGARMYSWADKAAVTTWITIKTIMIRKPSTAKVLEKVLWKSAAGSGILVVGGVEIASAVIEILGVLGALAAIHDGVAMIIRGRAPRRASLIEKIGNLGFALGSKIGSSVACLARKAQVL